MSEPHHVLVVGAGPAGLAIASACAELGLSVCCIAPDVAAAWTNNYGAWVDELVACGLGQVFDHTWSSARLHLDEQRSVRLPRSYGRIAGARLREVLLARAGERLSLRTGVAQAVEHDAEGSTLRLEDGTRLRGRMLIDASGFRGHLLTRTGRPADAYQVAYGVMARVEAHPYPLDELGFMDFRNGFLDQRGGPPTFLYAMPFGADRLFVEETSLVCRPALDFAFHERRLAQRLAHLGIVLREVEWQERCMIPMNGPLPSLTQRTLGFGAAAGFVHPASGYSVAMSLTLAPALARVLEAGLTAGTPLDALAQQAWQTLWPAERLRMRRVHLLGMELFVRARARGLRLFLGTFFRAPDSFWRAYLSSTTSLGSLAGALLPGLSTRPRLPS